MGVITKADLLKLAQDDWPPLDELPSDTAKDKERLEEIRRLRGEVAEAMLKYQNPLPMPTSKMRHNLSLPIVDIPSLAGLQGAYMKIFAQAKVKEGETPDLQEAVEKAATMVTADYAVIYTAITMARNDNDVVKKPQLTKVLTPTEIIDTLKPLMIAAARNDYPSLVHRDDGGLKIQYLLTSSVDITFETALYRTSKTGRVASSVVKAVQEVAKELGVDTEKAIVKIDGVYKEPMNPMEDSPYSKEPRIQIHSDSSLAAVSAEQLQNAVESVLSRGYMQARHASRTGDIDGATRECERLFGSTVLAGMSNWTLDAALSKGIVSVKQVAGQGGRFIIDLGDFAPVQAEEVSGHLMAKGVDASVAGKQVSFTLSDAGQVEAMQAYSNAQQARSALLNKRQ